MPRNVHWELFYHFVWHTKANAPMLTGDVGALAYEFLSHRVLETPEAHLHAVGGIEDHCHLAVSLPPTVELAKWIGQLKGACSHETNHGPSGLHAIEWQTGYGVVSFGRKDLPWVVQYIRNQRAHHYGGRVFDRLERITCEDVGSEHERPPEAR